MGSPPGPPPGSRPPPLGTESQTPVKKLPCPNFVAGGNNYNSADETETQLEAFRMQKRNCFFDDSCAVHFMSRLVHKFFFCNLVLFGPELFNIVVICSLKPAVRCKGPFTLGDDDDDFYSKGQFVGWCTYLGDDFINSNLSSSSSSANGP